MLTRKHSIEGKNPFGKAAELFNTLDADAATKLAMVAGDITLVLDETGLIVDMKSRDAAAGLARMSFSRCVSASGQ